MMPVFRMGLGLGLVVYHAGPTNHDHHQNRLHIRWIRSSWWPFPPPSPTPINKAQKPHTRTEVKEEKKEEHG